MKILFCVVYILGMRLMHRLLEVIVDKSERSDRSGVFAVRLMCLLWPVCILFATTMTLVEYIGELCMGGSLDD